MASRTEPAAPRDSAPSDGDGARLLGLVRSVAIAPARAHAIVERAQRVARRAAARRGGPEDPASVRRAVAHAVVERYARRAAVTGGATALTGVVPGIGAVAAGVAGASLDLALTMKLQVDMCMCLADAFGYDLTRHDGQNLSLLIAATSSLEHAGVELAARVASETGVRVIRGQLGGATLGAMQALFRRVGVVLTRRAVEKMIPFGIGVAFGGAGNYALTGYVGRQATAWFELDASGALQH